MDKKAALLFVIFFINLYSCSQKNRLNNMDEQIVSYEQSLDSISSLKIDSLNKKIQSDCDSAIKYRLPLLIDSLLKQREEK